MENHDLDKKQAEYNRHRRALEESSKATAAAAQYAAAQIEIARIEQNESLKRQEDIAENNLFRNTILSSIRLLDGTQRSSYIINQILLKNGITPEKILVRSDYFLTVLGAEKEIENINSKITDSVNFKTITKELIYIKKSIFKPAELELGPFLFEKDSIDIIESAIIGKRKAIIFQSIFLLLIIGFILYSKSTGLGFIIIAALNFLFLTLFLIQLNFRKVIKNKINSIIEKTDLVYNEFGCELAKSVEMNRICKLDSKIIFDKYFEMFIYGILDQEQSFIPSVLRPSKTEWRDSLMNERVVSMINEMQNEIQRNPRKYFVITELGFVMKSE